MKIALKNKDTEHMVDENETVELVTEQPMCLKMQVSPTGETVCKINV